MTAPSNDRTKPPPENPSTTSDFNGAGGFLLVFVLAALLTAAVVAVRRRRRRRVSRVPQEQAARSDGIDRHESPKASLGTPDVLVLTPATTDDDQRLRDRLAQETSAIFANLQLACSFEPAQEWKFDSARLTVKLARADGLPAPAPIAYSLRPLTEHDGTARENNVEIGADVKFVTVKAGEKQTRGGDVFVRGYGLQESTSYWQFTPTRNRRLEGSFWLWLIAKAPVETDLAITSSLHVQVSSRRWWSRSKTPLVDGVGEIGLVLGLSAGPPYRVSAVDASQLDRSSSTGEEQR